ncbi:acyltransferase domain-containing protein [Paenarthrobacter sp. NPDC089675]|uniref:acyltransferase domain-containing protein n=1 Tax=Paenarthrobacter sp. NPDC089675 TaxID=3364376 RepID=UPI00381C84ED
MTQGRHEQLFQLLDITGEDASECAELLAASTSPGVIEALDALSGRLGTYPPESLESAGLTEPDWIVALLRFAPQVHAYHLDLGISPEVSRAALSDFGLQLRINRRVHGRFGLDTWAWMTLHMAGNLFRLGRLQFHLIRRAQSQQHAVEQGAWVLGVHIPEDGSLSPVAVDASFDEARRFFAAHFADKAVSEAACDSWMLDPYLLAELPESNIASFARRFTVDYCTDAPTDAVYFTFRHRGLNNLAALPRETSLQRVVLERIDKGGTWQLGHGHLAL